MDKDQMAAKILDFLNEKLRGKAVVDRETSLISAGLLDSLEILDLVEFCEESFSVKFADGDMVPENFDCVEGILRIL